MYDSHCHLTDIADPEAVLEDARKAGVSGLLCCGYDAESNERVVALRRRVPGLAIALGLHPWYASADVTRLLDWIEREGPAAIGECGLEGVLQPEMPCLDLQMRVFEAQLDAASRLGLPVTVHSRKAENHVVERALAYPNVLGALHAYSGSIEQVSKLLERGWKVGVGGAVTRPNARKLRKLAVKLPLSTLLLETDAPAIGLEGIAPPNVRPYHVRRVAECLAELRGVTVEEIVEVTEANARQLFGT